eukprot:1984319-Amphidinium_carterae.1
MGGFRAHTNSTSVYTGLVFRFHLLMSVQCLRAALLPGRANLQISYCYNKSIPFSRQLLSAEPHNNTHKMTHCLDFPYRLATSVRYLWRYGLAGGDPHSGGRPAFP